MSRDRERKAFRYAAHLALRAAKRDGVFTLAQRYKDRGHIGTYGSIESLERAIVRQHNRMLKELKRSR